MKRTISQTMFDNRPAERAEELETVKRNIYRKYLDDLTIRKMRHEMQKKEWTSEDEKAYKEAYKKCTDLIAIEEAKPLFDPNEKLIVVSDEEYEKLLEEQAKKIEAEQIEAEQIEAEQIEAENTPITIPEVIEPEETIPEEEKANGKEA